MVSFTAMLCSQRCLTMRKSALFWDAPGEHRWPGRHPCSCPHTFAKGAGQLLLRSDCPRSTSYRGLTARLAPPGVLVHTYKVWGHRTGTGEIKKYWTHFSLTENHVQAEKRRKLTLILYLHVGPLCVYIYTQMHRPLALRNAHKKQGQLI